MADFERRMADAIEGAAQEIKNILRVDYAAAADRLPPGLPAPRLQLRWTQDEWERLCHYELVIPLGEHDIRNDAKTGYGVIELGRTRSRGGSTPWEAGQREWRMPYRDGAHARWDSAAFGGLPIYVLAPGIVPILIDAGTLDAPAQAAQTDVPDASHRSDTGNRNQ